MIYGASVSPKPVQFAAISNKIDNNATVAIFSSSCKSWRKSTPSFRRLTEYITTAVACYICTSATHTLSLSSEHKILLHTRRRENWPLKTSRLSGNGVSIGLIPCRQSIYVTAFYNPRGLDKRQRGMTNLWRFCTVGFISLLFREKQWFKSILRSIISQMKLQFQYKWKFLQISPRRLIVIVIEMQNWREIIECSRSREIWRKKKIN